MQRATVNHTLERGSPFHISSSRREDCWPEVGQTKDIIHHKGIIQRDM